MRFVSSLRRALLLNFIFAAVLPLILFALLTLTYVRDYLLEEVANDNQFLVGEVRADTEDFLYRPVAVLRHVSKVFYKREIIAESGINTYLEREVRGSDIFESIYLLNRNGEVVYLGVSNELEQQKHDYFSLDLSSHELYTHQFDTDEIYWSDTFTSVVTGKPSITLAMKVRNQLLVGNVSLEKINRIVSRFSKLGKMTFAVVDRKGILIAHSDPELALQRMSMMFHPEIANAIESGIEESLHLHEDRSLLESVLKIPEIGWVVWVGRERASVLEPIDNVQRFMGWALLAAIILGAFQSLRNSRKFMRPISNLVDGTQKLADGEYELKPFEKAYDEIDKLASGFDAMAEAVIDRETSIAERESRFRNLVNSIEGIVWEFDLREKQFVFVSRHSEDLLGCSYQQWLESPEFWKTYIHPDDRQWVNDYMEGLSGGRLSPQLEFRMINDDGHLLWVRNMVNVIKEDDIPSRMYGVIIDITERKTSEIALRNSEIRFRSLVEQAADAIYIHDRSGRFVEVNDRACSSLGYTRDELLKKSIDEVDVTHDPAQTLSILNSVRHGATLTLEGEYRRKNGTRFPAEVRLGSFTFEDKPLYLALVRDVSERKLAEEALRSSEEQVRLLLNSTAEGIYGTDLEGNCTFCNPAGLNLLGFENEADLLGHKMHDLIHHSTLDGEKCPEADCQIYNAMLSTETVHSDEEVFWRPDGSWFHVEYFGHPVIKDDELIGSVVTFHDITERKVLHQQSIRTAQLASLGELAAGVAHEINNPINGVINYAQILLNRMKKSDLETDLAERIMKEGERIAVIVKDLLFFAREGGPEVNLSNVSDVLSEALSLTEAQIRKEGILLKIDIEENLPLISTRAQQVQQLFLNILSNARHALNEKYPLHNDEKIIEVSIRSITKKKRNFVQIVFKDYGMGIPAAMLEKVMNPFVTTKPAGVGTGLGLSISHEIVENHNGDLMINSLEGEWTEVTVNLPVVQKDKG